MTEAMADITPAELARALEQGDAVHVLDVRAPHRLAGGTIAVADPAAFTNLPNSRLFRLDDPGRAGLTADTPVVTVCGHGNSSRQAAAWLVQHGVPARSLRGGMAAWMRLVVPRPIAPPAGFSHAWQCDRVGKGALAYLLVADGEAIVIDPPRDASTLLATLAAVDARLVAAADTHVHADYLSGGPFLGVPYHLHPADAVYPYDGTPGRVPYEPLREGQELPVGRRHLCVVHTPGHTEGSVSFLAGEAAFTGDFLFVDSIGRPDLAGKTAAWSAQLWDTLRRARREWSPDTVIFPAHYARDDERRDDRVVALRLGDLPLRNPVHRITDREAFLTWVREREGEAPEAYRQIKAVNLGLLAVTDEEVEVLEAGKNACAIV